MCPCPVVHLLGVSPHRWRTSLNTRFVTLLVMFSYWNCLLMGAVFLQDVPHHGWCLLQEVPPSWWWCALRRCALHGWCLLTSCALTWLVLLSLDHEICHSLELPYYRPGGFILWEVFFLHKEDLTGYVLFSYEEGVPCGWCP